MQTRDFVHVADVAYANLLALEKNGGNYQALNVGTGKPTSIRKLAELLLQLLGSELKPIISHEYRAGDIRHCYADITRIEKKLGFKPSISIEKGLPSFVKWVKTQRNVADQFEKAKAELERRGLTF
jgi:dTDP-L-rhamnose 4-epimerase